MKYINKEKLEKMNINSKNVYFILDFDYTITDEKSEDSWAACCNKDIMGKEISYEMNELYKINKPIEIDYTMDRKEKEKIIEKWYLDVVNLYEKYHMTKEKLNKSVENANIMFRKGAKECLKWTASKNIPVIIVSAGIGNTIEKFLMDNDCYYNNMFIISNFLKFDENGNIRKFEDKIVHSMNKSVEEKLPKGLQEKLSKKKYKILIGDILGDKDMAGSQDEDTIIKIGMVNDNNPETFEIFKKYFDIVLSKQDTNFEILNEIIKPS